MISVFSQAKEVAFDALFHILPINFCWLDAEGYILGCNERMLNLLGMSDINNIIGKHTKDIACSGAWENTKIVIESKNTMVFEEIHLDKNGNKTYFLSIKSPIKSQEGKIFGVVNIAVDISERKLMEVELEKSREEAQLADKVKTEFLYNMRHDLRTPFTGIIGLSELLERTETDVIKKSYLKDIVESSQSLLNHLNGILEYVSIESGEYPIMEQEFDIQHILEDIYNMMKPSAHNKKLDFTLVMEAGLPRFLIGDASRVQRIMMNIISNSIKFTEKGHVKIWVNWCNKSSIDGVLELYIEDTGIGIPDDKKEVIFERFNRLISTYKGIYSGTGGLGLKLVKQFLDEIGGQYNITTEVGSGTLFKLYIPYKLPLLP
jgi:PAS domain S-box-containing protein